MTAFPPTVTSGAGKTKGRGKISARPRHVVIVDDARSWRRWLRAILEQDPRLKVVGEAGSAAEAREVIKATNPDVLTLDIEMPGMNGLRFLEHLMRLRPMPVVMFSGHTSQTSAESVRALALGAVDCFHKTGNLSDGNIEDLRRRIVSAADSAPQRRRDCAGPVAYQAPIDTGARPLILIGASTGGVLALERILLPMPADAPPIMIVQHMPAAFLNSFRARLDGLLPHNVVMATQGRRLQRGDVVLAPSDGLQTGVVRAEGGWRAVRLAQGDGDVFTPSVDRLLASAAPSGPEVVAAVLTGIGRDGSQGAAALANAGGRILVQDEASCVVYGMPRSARAAVPGSSVTPLAGMSHALVDAVQIIERRRPQ